MLSFSSENGTGAAFQGLPFWNVSTPLSALAVGDFNHDRIPDVARNSIFLGNGDGTLGIASGPPFYAPNSNLAGAPGANIFLAVADVNNDGIPDILGKSNSLPSTVWIGNGDGTFQSAVTQNLGAAAVGFGVADFNFLTGA